MIVADTNLVIACVLRGTTSSAALAARARDKQWICATAAAKRALKLTRKICGYRQDNGTRLALKAFRAGLALVTFADQESNPIDVLNISVKSGLTSYDAEFVALAQERNIRLVTQDRAILQAHPDLSINIENFAAGK